MVKALLAEKEFALVCETLFTDVEAEFEPPPSPVFTGSAYLELALPFLSNYSMLL